MEVLVMFVSFSAVVTAASQVLKHLVKTYKPNVSCGLAFAILLGLVTSFTYGTGLLAGVFGASYGDAWYALGFRIVDLTMSGLIYAMSSKVIIEIYQTAHEQDVEDESDDGEQTKERSMSESASSGHNAAETSTGKQLAGTDQPSSTEKPEDADATSQNQSDDKTGGTGNAA